MGGETCNIGFFKVIFSGASGARSARRGAPWVIKFGKLFIGENLVMTSPYVRKDSPGRGK